MSYQTRPMSCMGEIVPGEWVVESTSGATIPAIMLRAHSEVDARIVAHILNAASPRMWDEALARAISECGMKKDASE